MRKLAILAVALCAQAIPAQLHNGSEAWPASHGLGARPSGQYLFLMFKGRYVDEFRRPTIDIVPLRSVFLQNGYFVLKTVKGIRTDVGAPGNYFSVPMGMTLVTDATSTTEATAHFAALEALTNGPIIQQKPKPKPTDVLSTYYVDKYWRVHVVNTTRRPKDSVKSWVKRHERNVNTTFESFKPDIEKTKKWTLKQQEKPSK